MRSSKGISDIAYDTKQSQVGVYTNSVIGIEPVFIIVNEWNIAELRTGLSKAIEMVNKKGENKFLILTDIFSLQRYVYVFIAIFIFEGTHFLEFPIHINYKKAWKKSY